MSSSRLVPLVVLVALVTSVALLPSAGASGAQASKSKCPKGKKLVVVKKKGKPVKKKCVKKTPKPSCRATASGCVVPAPTPAPGAPKPFEEPGKVLEKEAAKPFLEKYLLNSTFTDCVTGWPSCGGFENRFSHARDYTFYKCLLRPTSGSDVKSVGTYYVDNVKVEPNGEWTFHEVIEWYGEYAAFEWHVAQSGVVEGAYSSHPGETPEKIGPLTYVGGVAKNCTY